MFLVRPGTQYNNIRYVMVTTGTHYNRIKETKTPLSNKDSTELILSTNSLI